MPTDLEFEVLAPLRDALAQAAHGSRDSLIAKAASLLRCSSKTVYRKLQGTGAQIRTLRGLGYLVETDPVGDA